MSSNPSLKAIKQIMHQELAAFVKQKSQKKQQQSLVMQTQSKTMTERGISNTESNTVSGLQLATYSNKSIDSRPKRFRFNDPVAVVGAGNSEYEVVTAMNSLTGNLPINPGDPTVFPRLSHEARLYEKYRFLKAQIYIIPFQTEYAVVGESGNRILSFDYDVMDTVPSSWLEMELVTPGATGLPSKGLSLDLNVDLLNGGKGEWKFVRSGPPPGGSDPKTYDCGQIIVANNTCPTVAKNGTVWMCGEIEFCNSVNPLTPAFELYAAPTFSMARIVQIANSPTITSGATYLIDLSASSTIVATRRNGIGLKGYSTGYFTLPTGNYLVNIRGIASNATAPANTFTAFESLVRSANNVTIENRYGYVGGTPGACQELTFTNNFIFQAIRGSAYDDGRTLRLIGIDTLGLGWILTNFELNVVAV
jgi:hypothetical protein